MSSKRLNRRVKPEEGVQKNGGFEPVARISTTDLKTTLKVDGQGPDQLVQTKQPTIALNNYMA